jgi:hypothetical protein
MAGAAALVRHHMSALETMSAYGVLSSTAPILRHLTAGLSSDAIAYRTETAPSILDYLRIATDSELCDWPPALHRLAGGNLPVFEPAPMPVDSVYRNWALVALLCEFGRLRTRNLALLGRPGDNEGKPDDPGELRASRRTQVAWEWAMADLRLVQRVAGCIERYGHTQGPTATRPSARSARVPSRT